MEGGCPRATTARVEGVVVEGLGLAGAGAGTVDDGGAGVETRRFSASAPADGTAATVGPALNRAANEVALEVARWIG